jgi:ankyrin repeat protein
MMIARDDTNMDIKGRDGKTALMCAAKRGHRAAKILLLDTGRAEVNLKDNDSYTALIHAAANGHGSIIGLLVDYGAKPSIGDEAQRLPLSFAAEHGHVQAATILLNLEGVDTMAKDRDGQTALFWAVENGRQDMTRMLLEWQPAEEIPGRAKVVKQGFTSISNDETEVMIRLLDLRSISDKPWSGRTALGVAAEHGYDLVIERLLQNGYKPCSTDENSRTSLSYAAEKGHCALVKTLLEPGELQTNLRDKYGRTPFSYATQNGNLDVALMLSKWDSTGVDMEDYQGRTPFSYACEHGHVMMIQTLLSTDRIRVNMRDTDNRTPLFYAVGNGHLLVTKTLLNTGKIQLELTDVFGGTPFHYAAESG